MDVGKYILAMYDIRAKQDYIYKSNKIKEIMGGSYIIRDCFEDCLFPAAEKVSEEEQKEDGSKKYTGKGIYSYKRRNTQEEPAEFTRENFAKRMREGYLGEVVYDGGGNFFVLYKDIRVYRQVNRWFYHLLLKKTYSLRVLTTYIDHIDFENYRDDQQRIYAKHQKREQKESMLGPVNTLPVVQTDYRTSLPLSKIQQIGDRKEKVTYESWRKYEKYKEISSDPASREIQIKIEDSDKLDNLITEKGEESLLAVIYIDGNNMRTQVEDCSNSPKKDNGEPDRSYEACIKALREFSDQIQEHYIDKRINDVDEFLKKKEHMRRRFIVYAGDEVTFICNARTAYHVALEYLTKLGDESPDGKPRTSCAGIAVFHSHAPFREAYRIAEECCESAKKIMKEEHIENASLIDFHYCQGAFGTSLEEIRKEEETENSSRPWFVNCYESEKKKEIPGLVNGKYCTCETVQAMKKMLDKIGKGNLKNLALSAKRGAADFKSEQERICAHQKEKSIDFSLEGILDDETQRKLIYDMAIVYDIWFREE